MAAVSILTARKRAKVAAAHGLLTDVEVVLGWAAAVWMRATWACPVSPCQHASHESARRRLPGRHARATWGSTTAGVASCSDSTVRSSDTTSGQDGLMLMVIVGAGASYDSLNTRDMASWQWTTYVNGQRPPLARELFSARPSFIERMPPSLRGLAAHLRAAIASGATLEIELEILHNRGDGAATSELMAVRFYLERIIGWCDSEVQKFARAGSNFDALVRRLDVWSYASGQSVAYVTFNYDRFLEAAVQSYTQRTFETLSSYVDDPRLKIFKLHGSLGWVRQANVTRTNDPRDELHVIRNAGTLELSAISLASESNRMGSQIQVPALAVPTRTKTTFECPDQHLEMLTTALSQVDRVLVVGWRGGERHFLELLANRTPELNIATLVANGDAPACTECLDSMRAAVDTSYRYLDSVKHKDDQRLTFSELVTSDWLRILLERPVSTRATRQ
jgi:hypothetical protein